MTQATHLTLAVLLLLFLGTVYSDDDGHGRHTCGNHLVNWKPVKNDVPVDSQLQDRVLQTYQNIRILFDYSLLQDSVTQSFRDYIQDHIIPPAKNYLEATLKVKRASGKLVTNLTTICGGLLTAPSNYTIEAGGVDADLVIFVTSTYEPSSYVAFAGACNLDLTTNRPIFGLLNFNRGYITQTWGDAIFEANINAALHEITHILGFSNALYDLYIDPTTNRNLTGHYFNKTQDSRTFGVLNLPSLTSRLRTYFNCPTLEGAYLENEGSTMSAGSHFERKIFYNEYMTASAIQDSRISEFTLALLEGTGWYQVDYNMAEPMTYGKNKGCGFINSTCYGSGFDEFCSSSGTMTCSWTLRGAATCGYHDSFFDGCLAKTMYTDGDCEDSANIKYAYLGTDEFYGYGGKCFLGTLARFGSAMSQLSPYCFIPECEAQNNGGYLLKVKIGSENVTCNATGDISVNGYAGKLRCPDPVKFCTQIESEGYCKRKCSGRGKCVNKQCQCDDGWTSYDCSLSAIAMNCTQCAGKDPLTSCQGDKCMCYVFDETCACKLGIYPYSCPTTGTGSGTGTGTGGGTGTGTGTGTGGGGGTGTGTSTGTGTGTGTWGDGGRRDFYGSNSITDDSASIGVIIGGIIGGICGGVGAICLGVFIAKKYLLKSAKTTVSTQALPNKNVNKPSNVSPEIHTNNKPLKTQQSTIDASNLHLQINQ